MLTPFSLNLREMVNGVQTKSSDRMYKFYLQSVPQENGTQGEMSPWTLNGKIKEPRF